MITAIESETDPYIVTKKKLCMLEAILKMSSVEVVIDHLLDILIK